MVRNKKGDFFTDNALSVIIAVIGIGLLAVLAFTLYNAFTSTESDDAKTIVGSIEAKINAMDDDGMTRSITLSGITTKEGLWRVIGWGKGDDGIPDKCYPKSCVCVCKFLVWNSITEKNKELIQGNCQKDGFCEKFDEENIYVNGFEVVSESRHGEVVDADVDTAKIWSSISLPAKLIQIDVVKRNNFVNISHYDGGFVELLEEQKPLIEGVWN